MKPGVAFYKANLQMKCCVGCVLLGLLAGCATTQKEPNTAPPHRLHHVVVIWLKQSGDADVRQRYIDESMPLAQMPGVLSYDVGTPASIKRRHPRSALDESYDIAVASVFESQQAFEAFLKNPDYGRIAQQVLRPLVDKYRVYDFVE